MKIDQIIHSDRKSFGLEVQRDGRLIVRAPRHATPAQIQAVVSKKTIWIEKARARLATTAPQLALKTYSEGETFWYLGEQYPLQLINRNTPLLELDGSFLLSRHAKNHAKDVFIAWYREETRQITQALIDTYSKRFGFKVHQVRITSAQTRWGSCSGKNNLNFTYRLCMAPMSTIEYVVVHELVHLKIRNHSRLFWDAVSKIKPDYKTDRTWLKQNGYQLTID